MHVMSSCGLSKGECQIRNNGTGEIEPVKAGTPFVIPKGYDCQWQQSGYLRKYYVISEHPEEEIPAAPAHEGIVIPKADAVMTDSRCGCAFCSNVRCETTTECLLHRHNGQVLVRHLGLRSF